MVWITQSHRTRLRWQGATASDGMLLGPFPSGNIGYDITAKYNVLTGINWAVLGNWDPKTNQLRQVMLNTVSLQKRDCVLYLPR